VEGVGLSLNDGGFAVEMASLIALLLFGVVVVSVCYGFFKTVDWLYKKTRRQSRKTGASESESEG
jgi:Flp pilus assembly protein TadG